MIAGLARARPLAPLTSLGLGGSAEFFLEAHTREALAEGVAYAREHGLSLHILGGGSNLIVADAGVPGLVLRVATRGIRLQREGDQAWLTVEAGEPFENVVQRALDENLAGLECLAGIPGSTGATPMQNVGAYGQEVSDTIDAVEVLTCATGVTRTLSKSECEFAYRSSRFKRAPDGELVLSVRFCLRPGGPAKLSYAELKRAFAGNAEPTLRAVSAEVLRLRAQKSMLLDAHDPNGRSAGSFFTNPVVSNDVADEVRARALRAGIVQNADEVPTYSAAPGYVKLSAGWLIERAGITRGFRHGHVGVSTAHALCLVHHGAGRTRELIELADLISDAVKQAFSVSLVREPVSWGDLRAACAIPFDQP